MDTMQEVQEPQIKILSCVEYEFLVDLSTGFLNKTNWTALFIPHLCIYF